MFGKNEVTKQFIHQGTLLVNDLFYTIQGEGPEAGRPAIFLRLSKCNLRCYFCDTEFEQGSIRTVTDIAGQLSKMVKVSKAKLLVITGGEPFLQNFLPIVEHTCCLGLDVQVETAGTVMLPGLEDWFGPRIESHNTIVCSPKTGRVNKELVPFISAWKYVVKSGQTSLFDGLPDGSTQYDNHNHPVARPPKGHLAPIYISPMDECDPEKNKANMQEAARVCMQYGHRLSLQMHKLVGVP